MKEENNSPRKYINVPIQGSVLIKPKIYSGGGGWLIEPVDFTEASYYLGYKFDPRSMYSISSPKGAIRGGHMESRSKLVSVMSGSVFYVLVDMRPGEDQGKIASFRLGDSDKDDGRSILVPEGVVDAWMPLGKESICVYVGDKPYNAFDSLKTLDLFDKKLGISWPAGAKPTHDDSHRAGHRLLKLNDFIKSLI